MTNDILDDIIDIWHKSDSRLKLHEFLGVSLENYGKWVETNDIGYIRKQACEHINTVHKHTSTPFQNINYDLCLVCGEKLNFKVN